MEIPNGFAVYGVRYFSRFLQEFAGQHNLRFLQIGALKGDASVWLMENILTDPSSQLFDVDTWEGSVDLPYDFSQAEIEHYENVKPFFQQIRKRKMTSSQFLDLMPPDRPYFDFIYIDGDHRPFQVLNDAVDSYRRLKVGGIMAFDDYEYRFMDERGVEVSAHDAIRAFIDAYADRLELLVEDVQLWVRKVR